MNASVITEPSLEFGGGARHVDSRFGVVEYGPADLAAPGAPRSINVGLLGDQASIDQTQSWLEGCQQPIEGKRSDRPGLFPPFPGFANDVGYRSQLTFEPRLQRVIKPRALEKLDGLDPRKRVHAAVELYLDELQTLAQQGRPDVVICGIPRQDDASVAWNFFTALYYKAGGTPWRMVRSSTDLDACYVGVSFFKTADGKGMATSVAQVYNQRGDGVVVRGGPAQRSTEDRQLHLSEPDAYDVLRSALLAYRDEHRHAPARIIVHKTSAFDEHEREGMLRAAEDLGLDTCELVWVSNPTTRLYRDG